MKKIVSAKDLYNIPAGTELTLDKFNGFNYFMLKSKNNVDILRFIVNDLQFYIDAGIVKEVQEKAWTDMDMIEFAEMFYHASWMHVKDGIGVSLIKALTIFKKQHDN